MRNALKFLSHKTQLCDDPFLFFSIFCCSLTILRVIICSSNLPIECHFLSLHLTPHILASQSWTPWPNLHIFSLPRHARGRKYNVYPRMITASPFLSHYQSASSPKSAVIRLTSFGSAYSRCIVFLPSFVCLFLLLATDRRHQDGHPSACTRKGCQMDQVIF
jgi:hypothetical protein